MEIIDELKTYSLAELESVMAATSKKLKEIGFELHDKKTKITPLSQGVMFLGFSYHLTKTGKVVMTIDPTRVKAERKKLRRLVRKAKEGFLMKEKADESYRSWRSHAARGDSYKLLQRMDAYYQSLWR